MMPRELSGVVNTRLKAYLGMGMITISYTFIQKKKMKIKQRDAVCYRFMSLAAVQ
jgi:hypothetical protein